MKNLMKNLNMYFKGNIREIIKCVDHTMNGFKMIRKKEKERKTQKIYVLLFFFIILNTINVC